MNKYAKGTIWLVNLDPTVGSEMKKTRPAIIVSRSDYNLVAQTCTIIPISTGRYIESLHAPIDSLENDSHAVIPQMRVVSKRRLAKQLGKSSLQEINEINKKIGFFLECNK